MTAEQLHLIRLLTAAAVFGLVLSLWAAVVVFWWLRHTGRHRKVEQRLGLIEDDAGPGRVLRLWSDGREATTTVPALRRQSLWIWLEKQRADAGLESPVGMILLSLSGLIAAVFILALLLTANVLLGLAAAAAVAVAWWIYVGYRISRRSARFERQLVDALELAARSLRAGHPLVGAFRLISEEIPAPVGQLFAEIVQQQALGVGLAQAIRTTADASAGDDLQLFAASVVIQLRGGGNLADMMERLAAVIRDRMRLGRRMRVLTSQTQMSKRVLLAMPFFVFVILNLLNPEYMRPMYATATGQILLLFSAVSLLFGAWSMNYLARLRY